MEEAFQQSIYAPFLQQSLSCISCRSSSQGNRGRCREIGLQAYTYEVHATLTVSDSRLNDEIQSQTRGWQAFSITLLAVPVSLEQRRCRGNIEIGRWKVKEQQMRKPLTPY